MAIIKFSKNSIERSSKIFPNCDFWFLKMYYQVTLTVEKELDLEQALQHNSLHRNFRNPNSTPTELSLLSVSFIF
jgi:hypothetical protein